ncbi:MAG: phosphatidate cytidylyltransferase [Bacteroidota bacterium]|uniref:Phosphatidate cytidylyltransferase n=1 Tax=Christiangramia flava JLT2011 TaxID=1229726 RepID=A0A1L7I1A1_9FLAO|nr:phosphatidate cytidylyltransferase [Christiangramia flava]APU67387.1 Phosphatidate cytidylyltransferase [Christiangramia flava JLT2011]MAM18874.1 phosphatidate cytidylyltransferase [Christiangramia sp.]MEE2771034.1 phosphatidate cytidylyltransferase [Bacteroidota bacterium]OSS39972.1 Phosphatidate cytidylyltransferase [Christiangramia flava JLT2011]
MRETVIRTISGLLYISILVASILSSELIFILLFYLLSLVCLVEMQKLLRLKSYALYVLQAVLFYLFSFLKFNQDATILLLFITIFVNLFLVKDLIIVKKIPVFEKKKYIIIIFYLISSTIFLTLIPTIEGIFIPRLIIGIFLLIWTNDTFAFLIGKNFGKHKLYEKISPNKTIEGFMGGFVASVAMGFVIWYYGRMFDAITWIGLAIILSIFGTLGDLIQSKFKRQAGVKDSGSLMPGHGGLFDRLDSIIFASPFVYAYLYLLNYVS